MALLVSLQREVGKIELGDFPAVRLTCDELYERDRLLARHWHNRWMKADEPDAFVRLEISGPLMVSGPGGKLGPYQHFSTFDGVLYVEQSRVFGFWDVQNQDWYLVDAGAHWKELTLSFHTNEP